MATTYPQEFPLDNLRNIHAAIVAGNVKENIAPLAFDIWVVQGYAQSVLLGSEDEIKIFSASTVSVDIQPEAVVVQALANAIGDTPGKQAEIPWSIIVPYLLNLLLDYLAKR